MHHLSNQARSDGYNSARNQTGTVEPTSAAQSYKELIKKANSVPLPVILKHYGRHIDAQNRYIVCPFSFHKGGRESSSSFCYYPDTNTFWCFGCKTGTSPVSFVANKEGLTFPQAAIKILQCYGLENTIEIINDLPNYSERLAILMDFATFIRQNLQANPASIEYIEQIAFAFDKMNDRYSLTNEALQSLVIELKSKVVNG
jgi:CHC2 zinc finger